jgi:hypothetical protein
MEARWLTRKPCLLCFQALSGHTAGEACLRALLITQGRWQTDRRRHAVGMPYPARQGLGDPFEHLLPSPFIALKYAAFATQKGSGAIFQVT